MILEAKADSCFSSTHVIKVNGQAVGKFEGRFFSEGLDLSLTGMRRFKWRRSEKRISKRTSAIGAAAAFAR